MWNVEEWNVEFPRCGTPITHHPSLITLYCYNMCLDFSIERATAKSFGDRFCGEFGCFVQCRSITGLELISQRRSLAVCDGHIARRCGAAARGEGVDPRRAESAARK